MAIAKKDLFVDTNLKIAIGSTEDFPPENFYYKDMEFIVLGRSNKSDLIPVNVTDIEMQKIVTLGGLSEFICTDNAGNIYEACFYKQGGSIWLYAIGTREKPEKPKKDKGGAQ